MTEHADVAVTGLATMGAGLARNLAGRGNVVAVHNRTAAKTDALLEQHGDVGGLVRAESLADLVATLERPRKVIVMVQAGPGTDAVLDELVPLLEPGDVVMDGGNAHFTDTVRRAGALADRGLHLLGCGISGGEEGALHGPSIMPGGPAQAYDALGPLLEQASAHVDGDPCCTHVGPGASGHFVKMVHNGIEYADMQLLAESVALLRGAGMAPDEVAEVFDRWNQGPLESYLVEMTATVLRQVDDGTGRPFVDVVSDAAEQKGTGRWTVQEALELGVPVGGIAEAVFARVLSGEAVLRDASRGLPGPSGKVSCDTLVDDLERGLYAAKVVAYAQGFQLMEAGSAEHGWNIDLGAMARIWRGGCIIRARFLDDVRRSYAETEHPASLLVDPSFREALAEAQDPWRRVVGAATSAGIPVPGFGSALAAYDGIRAEQLPTSLIQALRDSFGSHGYRRVDREGSFHRMWSEDGRQVEV
jgi:6-phosphogluconate dehydrogenase